MKEGSQFAILPHQNTYASMLKPGLMSQKGGAILCGIVSGGVFCASAFLNQANLFFLFVPVIPLALYTLHYGIWQGRSAFITALLTVTILLGLSDAAFFLVLILIPLYQLLRKSLLWRGNASGQQWYPLLTALSEITLIIAAMFMTFMMVITKDNRQIKTLVAESLQDQMKNPNAEVEKVMKLIAGEWNFLLFVIAAWIWIMMIYAFSALAHRLLLVKHNALRPDFTLSAGNIPLVMLPMLLLTALFSAFGTGNDKYAGETIFMLLLLPYMLSGFATVHRVIGRFGNREILLSVFYILIFFLPFLAVLLAIEGIYRQIGQKSPDSW